MTKKKVGRCTPTTTCPAMDVAIRGSGAHAIGFHRSFQVEIKTGQISAVLAYRLPKATDGHRLIVVNLCPWCGGRLTSAPPKRKP